MSNELRVIEGKLPNINAERKPSRGKLKGGNSPISIHTLSDIAILSKGKSSDEFLPPAYLSVSPARRRREDSRRADDRTHGIFAWLGRRRKSSDHAQ